MNRPLEFYVEALKDQTDTLSMLPSYIYGVSETPKGRTVLAMDLGGSNFRIARAIFSQEGSLEFRDYKKMPAPGLDREISPDEFFGFFARQIAEFEETEIGFCFSYAAEILPDGDGRILKFVKNIRIHDAEGLVLGREINKRLVAMGSFERHFTVLNDTVATVIGTPGCNMGMVLGTGYNLACIKDGMIINTEAGLYVGLPYEEFDVGDMAERQIAGAYMPALAERSGLPAELLYDRGAKIVAAQIYNLSRWCGLERTVIAAEGSVFHNVAMARDKIRAYLDLLPGEFVFVDGKDKSLVGAAITAASRAEYQ